MFKLFVTNNPDAGINVRHRRNYLASCPNGDCPIKSAEALKILVEDWDAVRTSFVSFDLWRNQYTSLKMGKTKFTGCLSCGEGKNIPLPGPRKYDKKQLFYAAETRSKSDRRLKVLFH